METAVIILAILGAVFGLLGFIAAAISCITVIGWSRSTHKLYAARAQDTKYETDLPPGIVQDQLPSPPEPFTASQYRRSMHDGSFDELLEDP